MRDTILKDILITLTYIVFAILFEIVLFLFMGIGVVPKYPLFDLSFIILFAGIIMIIPNKKPKVIVASIILALQAVFSCVNITLFHIYGDIFTFDLLKYTSDAAGAFNFNVIHWQSILVYILMFFSSLTLMRLINRIHTNKPTSELKHRFAWVSLFIFSMSILFCLSFYRLGEFSLKRTDEVTDYQYEYFDSDLYLYHNLNIKIAAFKKFGSIAFYLMDGYNLIAKESSIVRAQKIKASKDYVNGLQTVSELGKTNSYSGTSDNNNVIVVLCESLEWFGIDPLLTPNLYNLSQTALSFNNHFSKNRTNISEGIAMLGSYSTGISDKVVDAKNNSYTLSAPHSLANMIKADTADITTSYFHPNTKTFYNRSNTHKLFGFDNLYFLEDMHEFDGQNGSVTNPVKDSEMFEHEINNIAPTTGERFVSFITTITTHGDYNVSHEQLADYKVTAKQNHTYLAQSLNSMGYTMPTDDYYQDVFYNYKAACMDLDKAIGILFEHLNANNLSSNTTVCLFSDHYAFMTNLSPVMKGFDVSELYNTELYRVPMFIYDEKILAKMNANSMSNQIQTFTNTYTIVPTLLDILGLDYKPGLYLGYSLFSEDMDKTAFISTIGGIFNDKYFSYDTSDILFKHTSATNEDYRKYRENAAIFYDKRELIENLYLYKII